MKKILVTTDFSVNSRAGMRFAIQLASQENCELTFFHSYYLLKPTSWNKATLREYVDNESQKLAAKLDRFVHAVYKSIGIEPKNITSVISESTATGKNIMAFADRKGYDFICLSTNGAGKIRKILGTNTSFLIQESPVPVIAVPSAYKVAPVTSLLFASDLANLKKELNEVISFAKPLDASIEMLHFDYLGEPTSSVKSIAGQVKKMSRYPVTVHFEKPDELKTFITNVESAIRKTRPSMLVMFTQQNRGFFEKLFLSSKSAEYSFKAKIPLLVFNREN